MGSGDGDTEMAGRLDSIISEFSDVFGDPGAPSEREIKHRIDLIDESV